MIDHPRSSGSHFSDAAILAGVEARRRKTESLMIKGAPEVFAVYLPDAGKAFGWEIRRYGSLVLQRGIDQFATAAEARVAGETALAAL